MRVMPARPCARRVSMAPPSGSNAPTLKRHRAAPEYEGGAGPHCGLGTPRRQALCPRRFGRGAGRGRRARLPVQRAARHRQTMAAQMIARQVDYALLLGSIFHQVVDKFIGESEKRLSALFDEANGRALRCSSTRPMRLFGKRREVQVTSTIAMRNHRRPPAAAARHLRRAGDPGHQSRRQHRRRPSYGAYAFAASSIPPMRRTAARSGNVAPSQDDRSSDIDIALLADPFELVGVEIRNAVYYPHLLAARRRREAGHAALHLRFWRNWITVGGGVRQGPSRAVAPRGRAIVWRWSPADRPAAWPGMAARRSDRSIAPEVINPHPRQAVARPGPQ